MTTKIRPTDKRQKAIGDMLEKHYNRHSGVVPAELGAEVADEIVTRMLPLGRSARRRIAVMNWATRVRDCDSLDDFNWALAQYGIFAGHAA